MRRRRLKSKRMRVDAEATAAMKYLDRRSYRLLDGREFVFGKDSSKRRQEIYERDMGMCQIKLPHVCPGRVLYLGGEWHHVKPKWKGGDDSLANGVWSCRRGHEAAHNRQPKWTRDRTAAIAKGLNTE